LHVFDYDKLSGNIIVRKAKEGEKITTLDNEKIVLNKDILVISDDQAALAVAGIKGGTKAKIDEKTVNIILEAANFDQKMIRKSSRITNLRTDASLRFEHNIDTRLTEKAINRVAKLVLEIIGGKVDKGIVDVDSTEIKTKEIKLNLKKAEKVLGISLDKKKSKEILEALGFKIEAKGELLRVKVPSYRMDVEIAEDLIEELGRINGYDKIESTFPEAILFSPKRNEDIFWKERIQDALKAAGLTEVYTYSFIGEKDKENFSYRNEDLVELENPMSVDYKYMRPSLIPNILKAVQKNQANFDNIEIFEIGTAFVAKGKEVKEKRMLSGAMKLKKDSFYELKGSIDYLLNGLGLSNIYYDDYKATPENSNVNIWHTGRTAEIKVDGKEIGFLGEINENILELMKIKGRVAVFNLDFEKIKKMAAEEHYYQEISSYPEAVRDLSIVVPNRVKVVDVLNVVNIAGGEIVSDVDLFDIYEGENLEEGMKSLAFHIIYQSKDKTLKSEEIDEIQQKIIKKLEINPNWQVRR
jgi:phenylalanyl-tRNA synthetase beta chain